MRLAWLILLALILSQCKQKGRLESTALSIKEINEIGELITAEYHGEVIGSLQESYLGDDSIRYSKAYDRLKNEYATIRKERRSVQGAVNEFKRRGLNETDAYKFLKSASKRILARRFLQQELAAHTWEEFYVKHRNEIDKRIIKDHDKTELVYLARGSVKAGFDLTMLGTLVMPQQSGDTLYLRNMDPLILDADINPWYIEEDEIPGFEVIKVQNHNAIPFASITKLKREMKLNLISQAMVRDIYQFAVTSGQEALAGLLVSPGSRIHTLTIIPSKYFSLKNEIILDNRVDEAEAILLQRRLIQESRTPIDSVWFHSLRQKQYYLREMVEDIQVATASNYNHAAWDSTYTAVTTLAANFSLPDTLWKDSTYVVWNTSTGFPSGHQWSKDGSRAISNYEKITLNPTTIGEYELSLRVQLAEIDSTFTKGYQVLAWDPRFMETNEEDAVDVN